jgi:hypothetical protein
MRKFRLSRYTITVHLCLAVWASHGVSQAQADNFKDSFVPGREYFILRSGNAKLILQADRSGLQPAVTYLLFDANKPCQTMRKERAFNYSREKDCSTSALEVVLGGVPFVALGHMTQVRWCRQDGIPTVEARWWAGGIEVKESFTALGGSNAFLRSITLNGKDLAGPDSVRLRLHLPPGKFFMQQGMLVCATRAVALGIGFENEPNAFGNEREGYIETPEISVSPDSEVTITSVLVTRVPARGYVYDLKCGDDQPIPPEFLRSGTDKGGLKGVKAEYFNNITLAGSPEVVRIDTSLTPYWDTSSPGESVRPDSFSVRWTGSILAPRDGVYKFSLVADDRARLFLSDSLLIDCWDDPPNVTKTGEMFLKNGSLYRFRVEYAEITGWAGMRLKWSIPPVAPEEKAVEAGVLEMFASLRGMLHSSERDRIAGVREYWNQTSFIDAGDSLIQHLFDNSRFSLPGMIGPNGAMDAGIFEYGDQWVRDCSNVVLGLVHAGQFELAKAVLNHVLSDLVSGEGTTIVAGAYDQPDREEFDQMGVLMHALKSYRDWTGDSSLIINSREKIITMIERPLRQMFRDSTGMVHNRREYWERTFDDAYELAYQTFMICGLRDAADLAGTLGVPEKATVWRSEANAFLQAMLHHPSSSLVDQGALIKRRNVDGSIPHLIAGPRHASKQEDPYSSEAFHSLNPDATYALPISLGVIDPKSELARKTLDKLEAIWNARWDLGGYERYHSSSQPDQPGPWTFATASIARSQHDAGLHGRSRRSLEWLSRVQGGNAGAWFEEIPLLRSQMPTSGIIPWTSAELVLFTVRHWLGVSFEGRDLVLRPNLFDQNKKCKADLRFRSSRLRLEIDRVGEVSYALVNTKKILPRKDGAILVCADMLTGNVDIKLFSKVGAHSSGSSTESLGRDRR